MSGWIAWGEAMFPRASAAFCRSGWVAGMLLVRMAMSVGVAWSSPISPRHSAAAILACSGWLGSWSMRSRCGIAGCWMRASAKMA